MLKNALRSFFCTSLFLLAAISSIAHATETALLIVDLADGQRVFQQGDTQSAYAPCSTFKIPLALMGFDQKILTNPNEPLWPYKESYAESRKEVQKSINPTSWLAESAIWYSQQLTRTMGEARFKQYVDSFHYGNRDISGDPGKNNGLTRAWLSSSLKISPEEQIVFLRSMLQKQLPVSDHAVNMTKGSIPVFTTPENWKIYGKTGSGSTPKADSNERSSIGWFVGWAEKNGRTLVFAMFMKDGGSGSQAREILLTEWGDYVAADGERLK